MVMSVAVVFSVLIRLMLPTALLCILQYFLSKMENPWPGRVLPILSGLYALGLGGMILFNMVGPLFGDSAGVSVSGPGIRSVLYVLVMVVIWFVPAVLFTVIYRRTRRHMVAKKDMDKMSIQDLE